MTEFTIFSTVQCLYCTRAKTVLRSRGLEFEELDAHQHGDMMRARVLAAAGAEPRTVPQIFHGDQYIGGFDQLVPWLESNATADT